MKRLSSLVLAALLVAPALAGCALDSDDELVDDVELAVKNKNKDKKKDKDKNKNEDKKKDDNKKKDDRPRRFDVLTHNIGGSAENDGGLAGIKYTFSRIDAMKPDVVMLEEVCQEQLEAFQAKYPTWNVAFSQMTANEGNLERCNGKPKGQLLASPRPMTEAIREDLGEVDGWKHFTLLCGSISMPDTARKVLACVTHLRAGESDAERERQAQRIHRHLKPSLDNGQAVILAGDFNSPPRAPTLDPLYRLTRSGGTGGGDFDEADQTDPRREKFANEVSCAKDACRSGEGTMANNNAKIDYIFFSHNRVAAELNAEVDGSGGSAHRLYRAWTNLNLW